jgi:hypothetical protein
VLKISRSKETIQIAVVKRSQRNKWGYSENIRRETSRQFRNIKREYLKEKIDEVATSSKNKNTRV